MLKGGNVGDEEGGQVSSKRVVILAAPADMNYDLGTKVSYKKYLKLIWWPDIIYFCRQKVCYCNKEAIIWVHCVRAQHR